MQAIPIGQVMGPVQGEQPEPQANVQTPFRQAPPAATQSAQATSASGGPQVRRRRPGVGWAGAAGALLSAAPGDPAAPGDSAAPGDPAGPADSATPANSPRAGRAGHATGRIAPCSRRIARGVDAVAAGTAGRVTAGATLTRQRLAATATPTATAPRRRETAGAAEHRRALPPPDVVTTAESPDRSTRHPTPRSGTRTDMNNAGNRGPVFNFLRSFERAPSRRGMSLRLGRSRSRL